MAGVLQCSNLFAANDKPIGNNEVRGTFLEVMDFAKRIARERSGGLGMKPESAQKSIEGATEPWARNENPFL